MKKIIYLVLGVLAFVLAGCQTIDQLSPYRGLTAVIEGAQDTKTSIFPSSLSSSDVLWSDGDEIGVFIDDSLEPTTFTLATGAGSKVATFTGEGNGDSYIAFYPQSMLDSRWNNTINFDLPAEQEYVLGTFADNAFPMIAASNSSQLQFKNLCSVVRISMVGSQTISKIVFTANDPSVKVSGPASVDVSASGEPKLVMDSDASNSVTLNTGNVQLSETSPTEFYFVLPPQTYKGGFTVSIYSGDVCMEKKYESDFTMVRSRLHKADLFGFEEPEVIEGIEKYLTFTSEGTSTISLVNEYGDTPVLYYSFDGENWAEWDYSELSFSTLYLCGDNPGGFSSPQSLNRFATGGSKFSVSGDIMSLIDNVNDMTEIPVSDCFAQLFLDCSNLTEAPELPATVLKYGCYMSMFSGCSSLVAAPELPATSLDDACYNAMFQWCSSLTEAPELPATEVPWNAYGFMFEGCSSLRTAPELPATDIESLAYEVMFRDCSSLTAAPALPAMTVPSMAYSSMFEGCTSLTEAPALPATTLGSQCYGNMFKGCTSLRTAPELPATDISAYSYYAMFSGCTSLTEAPELPATELKRGSYYQMFSGCTSLNYVKCLAIDISAEDCVKDWMYGVSSSGTFVIADEMDDWHIGDSGIPQGWTVLNESGSPVDLIFASNYLTLTSEGLTTISLYNEGGNAPVLYWSITGNDWHEWDYSPLTFGNGMSLYLCGDNPDGLNHVYYPYDNGSIYSYFITSGSNFGISGSIMSLVDKDDDVSVIPSSNCFAALFLNCSNLTDAPELPAMSLTELCYRSMFSGCTSLTAAPELPATSLTDGCYYEMFFDCRSLTSAPELPATTLADVCYCSMFEGCSSLTYAPELPAGEMTISCYSNMFANCTSLKTAPELPATTLAGACYWHMFSNCTNLTAVPELPAATLEEGSYGYMFKGCNKIDYVKCLATDISAERCTIGWMEGVASSGTFVKAAGMNDWPTGSDGIPSGWVVQNEGGMPEPTLEAVDLGLSVKWANFNVGAASPEDFGDYFAWGETSTKASYDSWSNYSYGNGSNDLTKYCESDGKTVLEASDDAATAELGSSWRMPTHDELQELVDECTWTWQSSGVPGYTVTGPNGNSIFLPAAAHSAGTDGFGNTVFGFYWASDINDAEGGKYRPYYLHFTSDESSITVYNNGFRPQGSPVRAVCD